MDGAVVAALLTAIGAAITAIGAAILAPIIQYRLSQRKESRDDFAVVKEGLQRQIDMLNAQVLALTAENKRLSSRIAHLKALSEHDLPMPNWSKDRTGRYQWVNVAFVQQFLEPSGKDFDDIVGKTDEEIWPQEVAERLKQIDHRAMTSPARRAFESSVKFDLQASGCFTVFKWPLVRGASHIGWMAMAIPES